MKQPQPVKADDNKKKYYKALMSLHSDIEAIKKDENNPFFKSKYVALPKMLRILKPLAQKHGFVLSQPTDAIPLQQGGVVNLVLSHLMHAETGLGESAKLAIENDMVKDKNMQGLGGAITYARRYTLSALFGLEEVDDDGETAVGRVRKSVSKSAIKSKDNF